jgi:hypothetical protein
VTGDRRARIYLAVAIESVLFVRTRTSWGQWVTVSRPWLWLRGFRRPLTFRDEAYRRGVLRQASAGFQFRHSYVRQFFAGRQPG